MSSIVSELRLVETELLPEGTCVHQTEEGSRYIHFHARSRTSLLPEQSLFVRWEGEEKYAELPQDTIDCLGEHGNAMYFVSGTMEEGSTKILKNKLHKATFTPDEGISVIHLRDKLEDEYFYINALCGRVIANRFCAYKMCDDPENGVIVDITIDQINEQDLTLIGVHRGKAIFLHMDREVTHPSARQEGQNTIIITSSCGLKCTMLPDESNPLIYFSCPKLYCLNPETCEIRTFQLTGFDVLWHIAGVRDDLVSINAAINVDAFTENRYLITVKLPLGNSQPSEGPQMILSRFVSEFSVNRILGVGGCGMVFDATNNLDECNYAVKRIAVIPSNEAQALKEVRALAKLDHPGIIRYNSTWIEKPPEGWQFDADCDMITNNGLPRHLFMGNYSLAEWLSENNSTSSRPLSRMKMWFKQMVEAVAYIHKCNLIHRDLKPSNVLFVETDQLKLCDLGIVTDRREEDATESAMTRSSCGSDVYKSPEHISLDKYSSKTDVFALGLIFVELSVVLTPVERYQFFDRFRKGQRNDLDIDAKTSEFVTKLTNVDPNDRPSCREMLDDLYLA